MFDQITAGFIRLFCSFDKEVLIYYSTTVLVR